MAKTDRRASSKGGNSKGRKGVTAKRTLPFILFHIDNVKRSNGNMYSIARSSGAKWRAMSQAQKDKWYAIFYRKYGNKNSKNYKKWKANQQKGGRRS